MEPFCKWCWLFRLQEVVTAVACVAAPVASFAAAVVFAAVVRLSFPFKCTGIRIQMLAVLVPSLFV